MRSLQTDVRRALLADRGNLVGGHDDGDVVGSASDEGFVEQGLGGVLGFFVARICVTAASSTMSVRPSLHSISRSPSARRSQRTSPLTLP